MVKDGCLTGLWGTQLDITALKNAEEALRRSEARIRALLNAFPDMIMELSLDGMIINMVPPKGLEMLMPANRCRVRELLNGLD